MIDMVLISTDYHICKAPTLFDDQLWDDLLASAPKLETDTHGKNYWEYQAYLRPSVGLNAAVGDRLSPVDNTREGRRGHRRPSL